VATPSWKAVHFSTQGRGCNQSVVSGWLVVAEQQWAAQSHVGLVGGEQQWAPLTGRSRNCCLSKLTENVDLEVDSAKNVSDPRSREGELVGSRIGGAPGHS
jgi:hypothetical protein